MASTEEKISKTKRSRQGSQHQGQSRGNNSVGNSALDAAIAAAISAPKPPKKSAQFSSRSKTSGTVSRREEKKQSQQKRPARQEKQERREQSKAAQERRQPPKRRSEQPQVLMPEIDPAAVNAALISSPVRIIALGGLQEIGKNMYIVEYGRDMVIVDCGMTFPDAEMPGVDIVIPDFSYVEKNISRVRGVILTHGHEDHIGGIPYLLKKVDLPVYGTKLTIGLVENKLKEHNLSKAKLHVVNPSDVVKLGGFTVEFIRVNHSIPGAVAVAIRTPAGTIIHMGDFKVDYTPIEGGIIDLPRLAQLGSEGVLALMSDSTNAERPGFTASERRVGDTFDRLFAKAGDKRIIIATFSSNVHRVQQVINCAQRYGRKVAVFGRSMINVIKLSAELGYLDLPEGILIDIDRMRGYKDSEIVLITTGSQGEPMSALTRMALNDHRQVSITENDYIIISARPIPGNEKLVGRVVNKLLMLGAAVVYEEMYEVHVSGHACCEEQKLILSLVRPKYFIPVHGEYKHLAHHAATAREIGIPAERIVLADIGNVIEIDNSGIKLAGSVPAGKVMIDGNVIGDVGSNVLKDRKHLAQDGVIAVSFTVDKLERRLLSGPELISRGFVYEKTSEELMQSARQRAKEILVSELSTRHDYSAIKNKLISELGDYFFSKTRRRPIIIPTVLDI